MRNAFIRALTEGGVRDERVVFLTADLGYKLFDDFARRCPGRFFNVGIAEANMAGVATGLALEGKKPFIYSIVPFATLRCYEQLRDDVAYHDADVTVVGVGGGYSYGANGATHHSLEDVGALRMLPNMVVLSPGDPHETEAAVAALMHRRGPAYLRLGRAGEAAVHPGPITLEIGRAIELRAGGDAALIGTGSMLSTCVQAVHLLEKRGISCGLFSMPTIKPLDSALIERLAREVPVVVTAEEHGLIGGLGSAVAEVLAESGCRVRFRRFGARDHFAHECGDQAYHRKANALDAEALADAITALARPI
ncbi:MAG TPA: transketolase C-terminal domain-containing protein [Myxococcales bacterium]|nr:transketolase C-terminal domain-containing protein [Myxococcales bacterium]